MNSNPNGSIVLKLFVPTTNYDQRIDDIELENRFIQSRIFLNSLYGGCTRYQEPVIGSYVSNSGEIITEELYLIESFTNDLKIEELKKGIEILKKLWDQESITVKISRSEEYLFF